MTDTATLVDLFKYNDHANDLVYRAASPLGDDLLDRPLDIGLGSLRRILIHIYNGEFVWLKRWQGQIETGWPREDGRQSPEELLEMLRSLRQERDAFVHSRDARALDAVQIYRDSRGSLFQATLREMILQGFVHSTHHRAQAVNAIRRLGGKAPEVDLMVSVRRPAQA
jgi:uncharacterized damage-inducible protein DinB